MKIPEGVPPFRGKAACSDFMHGTYYIVYGIDTRPSVEDRKHHIKKYIEYLQHWCSEDKGVEQEVSTLEAKSMDLEG